MARKKTDTPDDPTQAVTAPAAKRNIFQDAPETVDYDFGDGILETVIAVVLPFIDSLISQYPSQDWTPSYKRMIYGMLHQDFLRGRITDSILKIKRILNDSFASVSEDRPVEEDRFEFALCLVASFGYDIEMTCLYIQTHQNEFKIISKAPEPKLVDVNKEEQLRRLRAEKERLKQERLDM